MATEQFANNAVTTLGGAIGSGNTSLTVVSATAFPTTGQFRVKIDSEIILVTAVSGTTFTVTRGAEGTAAAAHATGATVTHTLTAGAITQLKADILSTYTTYNIPDPTSWTDTGTIAPFYNAQVVRVGTTLYAFGGTISAVSTSKIWSAPYAAGTPTFSDTGATLPMAVSGMRVGIINDGTNTKIWGFGSHVNDTVHILSAPIGTPLSWTDVTAGGGSTLSRADNCGFAIANGIIALMHGNSNGTGGGGISTYQYTSTTHPGTGWATSAALGSACWENGGYALRGTFVEYGGVLQTQHVGRVVAMTANLTGGIATMNSPILPVAVANTPIACDNGTEVFVLGYGSTEVLVATVGSEAMIDWRRLPGVLPASASYIYQNGPWVGPDGYAYYINQTNAHIIRSGRKTVYVPLTATSGISDPYAPLNGVYADGTPAIVSRHVLSGNPSWVTNLTTAY